MAAPIASQVTPANGETLADLDVVSVVWTPQSGDAIDTTQFTVMRGATSLTPILTPLGAGIWKVSAEASLWPDETNVSITFGAKSVSAAAATATTTFATRGGWQDAEQLNVETTPITGGEVQRLRALVAVAPAGDSVRLHTEFYFQQSDTVKMSVTVYSFIGAADMAMLLVSVTHPIEDVLGMCSIGIGPNVEGRALNLAELDGLMANQVALDQITLSGPALNQSGAGCLDIGVPFVNPAPAAATVGKQIDATALAALDACEGSGMVANVDLLEAALDDIR
jgi:hypothetical protein